MSKEELPPGEKYLEDYVLQSTKRLGKGTFADVFAGYRRKDKMPVAVKLVSRTKLNKKLQESLDLEIGVLKSVNHPNIIKLYDVYRTSKYIYMVMEYCGGGTLSQFIRDVIKGPLSETQVKIFFGQIVRGLAYLNQKSLIHRDLKPQNILLTDTSNPILKIADFGFARNLMGDQMAETQCGTPLYMSPEVLKSEKYDGRADLWSLGIILYEMFHGKVPYGANNMISLLEMIKSKELEFKNCSQNAMDLMKRLLVIDMNSRITFEQFLKDPFVLECLDQVDLPKKDEISLLPSPRMSKPKTSPFKEIEKNSYEEFVVIEKNNSSIHSMITNTESGNILYPKVIFDFASYAYKDAEQLKVIRALESLAKQAWAIAELGVILEKSNDRIGALALMVRSIQQLTSIMNIIRDPKRELESERPQSLYQWCYLRCREFYEIAYGIGKQVNQVKEEMVSPEELLYFYVLRLIKDASYQEFLGTADSNSICMYKRSKYVIEYLLNRGDLVSEDVKYLKDMLPTVKTRINILSKK